MKKIMVDKTPPWVDSKAKKKKKIEDRAVGWELKFKDNGND